MCNGFASMLFCCKQFFAFSSVLTLESTRSQKILIEREDGRAVKVSSVASDNVWIFVFTSSTRCSGLALRDRRNFKVPATQVTKTRSRLLHR